MTLADLTINQKAHISMLPTDYDLAAQLLEQGFVPNAEIFLANKAPFNGLMAVKLNNFKVTVQSNIAKQIKVTLA